MAGSISGSLGFKLAIGSFDWNEVVKAAGQFQNFMEKNYGQYFSSKLK